MIIKAGQQVMDPVYGPKIYIDGGLKYERSKSVTVDNEALGENLRRDFPKLTQEDWVNNVVCVTDKLHERLGGFTVNALSLRSSRGARFSHGLLRQANFLFSSLRSPVFPTARWIIDQARGHEVLTVVNLSADPTGSKDEDGFFDLDNPPTLSNILAHELHHATGMLLDNRILRDHQAELKKHQDRVARHVGSFLGGSAAAFGGLFALVETAGDGVAPPVTSGSVMLGGAVLAGTVAYIGFKYNPLSVEGTVLDLPDHKYSEGERAANAYALATDSNWAGVIAL